MDNVQQAVRKLNAIADQQNKIVDALMVRGVDYDLALENANKIIPIPPLLRKYVLTNMLYERANHYRPPQHMHYNWSKVEH